MEVKNRVKGLDLIDRVPEELWMEVCDIVQKAVIRISNNMEITDKFKLKDILKTDAYFMKLSSSRKIKMGEELFQVKETKEV